MVWYVKDLDKLNEASIVEHVLNYGDWDDVQEMIKILGMQKTAEIFREKSTPDKFGRQNRSEEHTSELQSRLHLVCRLLL